MPSKTEIESRKVRRLIAGYLRLWRGKRVSSTRLDAVLRQIGPSIEYLDQNAIAIGTPKSAVEKLLGPAPGQAGPDRWFYPGGADEKTYQIQFQSDVVASKDFLLIYTN